MNSSVCVSVPNGEIGLATGQTPEADKPDTRPQRICRRVSSIVSSKLRRSASEGRSRGLPLGARCAAENPPVTEGGAGVSQPPLSRHFPARRHP